MYPTASAPQYAFGPGLAPVPMPVYKKGGEVEEKQTYGLENAAEMIRQRGRGDDTILAHINPQEAGILKLLGGSGTTNPYTGLPEFKFLPGIKSIPIIGKPLYQAGSSVGKAIESGVESIAKALGPVGQVAAAYFGGPIGAALYAGLAPEGSRFNVQNAIKAGALTYAGNAISGAPDPMAPRFDYSNPFGGSSATNLDTTGSVPTGDASSGASSAPSVTEAVSAPTTPPVSYADVGEVPGDFNYNLASGNIAAASAPEPGIISQGYDALKQGYTTATEGIKNLVPEPVQNAYTATKDFIGDIVPEDYRETLSTAKDVATVGGTLYGGYAAYKTKQELDAAKDEAERILADQANRKQEEVNWARNVMATYAPTYARLTEEDIRRERGLLAVGGRINSYDDEGGGDDGMMRGGIAALAEGGLPPRYLSGGGDGMSDSIKANIDGKQEARLADGEFVVPADVVSHLGNGSSNAGAKKLYAMMDRVRKSRTGKTRQAPEVNTRRLMPA